MWLQNKCIGHDVHVMSMQLLRDVHTTIVQCVARTSREHRVDVTRHSLIYFTSWERILLWECRFFTHGKYRQYKKNSMDIHSYDIWGIFCGFFFFTDLVEWRKGEICTFSHTIRLTYVYSWHTTKKRIIIKILQWR
jgi:hypothetical protein